MPREAPVTRSRPDEAAPTAANASDRTFALLANVGTSSEIEEDATADNTINNQSLDLEGGRPRPPFT
jgi:hypothetical protein